MPPPNPNLPVVDPNSALGRRLLGQEQRQSRQQPGLVMGDSPMGAGMDTGDPRIQAILQQQHAAATAGPAPSPAAIAQPEGGRLRDAPAIPPGLAFSPTPAELASGNVAVAPAPTQDPFRVLPARQSGDRTLSDGTILPGEFFGPGMAGMTGNGFQPGLMQIGGMTTAANDPAAYLMGIQQQARINGVNPGLTLESLLNGFNSGADRSARSSLAAQGANVNLAGQRLQGDAQRDAATTQANGQARAAAFSAIPGLIAAAGTGTVPPPLLQSYGDQIQRFLDGGPRPANGPSLPGAAPGAPGVAPAAPGGGPAVPSLGAAIGATGAGNDVVAGLLPAFNIPADGKVPAEHQITPEMAMQFLDRLQARGVTDEQRRQVAGAIQARRFGDPQAVRNALLSATGISHFRAAPPVDPRTGEPAGGLIGGAARAPYVVNGAGGRPLMTFQTNPRSNAFAQGARELASHGVGYTQIVGPNGEIVEVAPTQLRPAFGGGNAAGVDRNRAGQGSALYQLLSEMR